MKKILAIILVVAMIFSMTACAKEEPTPTPAPVVTPAPATATPTPATPAPTPAPTVEPEETETPSGSDYVYLKPTAGLEDNSDTKTDLAVSGDITVEDFNKLSSSSASDEYTIIGLESATGDISIDNSKFIGTVYVDGNMSTNNLIINVPNADVVLGSITAGTVAVSAKPATTTIAGTIKTTDSKITIEKGSVTVAKGGRVSEIIVPETNTTIQKANLGGENFDGSSKTVLKTAVSVEVNGNAIIEPTVDDTTVTVADGANIQIAGEKNTVVQSSENAKVDLSEATGEVTAQDKNGEELTTKTEFEGNLAAAVGEYKFIIDGVKYELNIQTASTIASVVNQVSECATIYVLGTHNLEEQLKIEKSVSLVGLMDPTVNVSNNITSSNGAVMLTANDISIDGINFVSEYDYNMLFVGYGPDNNHFTTAATNGTEAVINSFSITNSSVKKLSGTNKTLLFGSCGLEGDFVVDNCVFDGGPLGINIRYYWENEEGGNAKAFSPKFDITNNLFKNPIYQYLFAYTSVKNGTIDDSGTEVNIEGNTFEGLKEGTVGNNSCVYTGTGIENHYHANSNVEFNCDNNTIVVDDVNALHAIATQGEKADTYAESYNGLTVVLANGTYDVGDTDGCAVGTAPAHYLYIDNPMTLKAETSGGVTINATTIKNNQGDILKGGKQQQTIMIESSDVTIEGLIVNATTEYDNKTVELLAPVGETITNITVKNCTINGVTPLYIGSPDLGEYHILNNTLNGNITVTNGGGNAMVSGEEAEISGNTIDGYVSFAGTANTSWTLYELDNYPLFENNSINGEDFERDEVEYTAYIRSYSKDTTKLLSSEQFIKILESNIIPSEATALDYTVGNSTDEVDTYPYFTNYRCFVVQK